MWTDALTVFLDNYEPVKDIVYSTHQFSTHEIVQTLVKHTGEDVSTIEVVETLTKMGYTYMRTGEMDMEWLFKQAAANALR
jgi:predicted RNA methylase